MIALPLGLLIGTFRPVQALLEPLTDFIRYMPAVAFIPLVMLWIGIDEASKIAIIFIGTFFQMVLMVAEDVRRVPQAQIEAAQTMGATRGEIIELVLLPARQAGAGGHAAHHHGLGLDLPGRGRAGGGQLGAGLRDSQGAALPADRQDLRRHHHHRPDRADHRSAVPLGASHGLPMAAPEASAAQCKISAPQAWAKCSASRRREVVALQDIDLDVDDNEFVTLVGASGCGKSTLLRIIGGLEYHTSGEVVANGKPVRGPGADRAMVFQQYSPVSLADGVREHPLQPPAEGQSRASSRRPTWRPPPAAPMRCST